MRLPDVSGFGRGKKVVITKKTDDELSEETIRNIEHSLDDIKAGRTLSMKQVKQRLNMP